MKQFLQAVSDFHLKDYGHRMRSWAEQGTPCALFYYRQDEYLEKTLKPLLESGIHLSVIVTLGGNLPSAPVPTVHAKDIPSWKERPQVVFFPETGFANAFTEFFHQLGMTCVTMNDVEKIRPFEELYDAKLSELYAAYADFADEASKRAYLGAWKYQASSCLDDFDIAPEPQYFLHDFAARPGDVVIDGGAFDGETGRQFQSAAGSEGQVFSFEMDAENFPKCQAVAEKYGFVAENMGLSDHTYQAGYLHGGNSASSTKQYGGNRIAQFTSIDEYVVEHDLPRVDFIKLDIEGAELEALQGAALTIARWKPRMAISAYHKPEDFWTLQQYIKSLRPDYVFAFRHYGIGYQDPVFNDEMRSVIECFPHTPTVPTMWERVLYCR